MPKIYENPSKEELPALLKRPAFQRQELDEKVNAVLKAVQAEGDAAVRRFTTQFDGVEIDALEVPPEEVKAAGAQLSEELRAAIQTAARNIEAFHAAQQEPVRVVETMPGIRCWRKSVAIEKVGLYIPGGTAPLFSTVLMLGIPAKLAGCSQVVLCSPPDKTGRLHPAILHAAHVVGVHRVFRIGGVQAVGALAYGTPSVPAVHKIFGPGNQYVMAAKAFVQRDGVAIDMPAGPSEVMVVADDSAIPPYVAADLLAQAEHGPDSQVILITTSRPIADAVNVEIDKQLQQLPRNAIAAQALANSKSIVVKDLNEAMSIANQYACEHLLLQVKDVEAVAGKVVNAGSVFLGNYSPEAVGDYASGTNHTLPTNGYARMYSGVSLDSFVKKVTFQHLDEAGLKAVGPAVELMAAAESLEAHKQAVTIRLASLR